MADLTPKQHRAITALMSSLTVAKAAELTGVNERTIYAWLAEPVFAEAYRGARREAVQVAIGRLEQASGAAVGVLISLMSTGTPTVKLGAARMVLEMAIKAVELEDIAARLAALEEAHAKKL